MKPHALGCGVSPLWPFQRLPFTWHYMAGVLVPTRQEIEEEGRSLGVRVFMLFGLSFVLVNATMFLVQKYRGGTPSTALL